MGRLRVSVSAPSAAARTGHGRVWERGVAELSEFVRVVSRRPDVWLADGHGELPETDRPVVAVVHEAPWEDPRTVPHLHPEFVAAMRERLEAVDARATRIVVPSQAGRAQLRFEAVDVVPYGVDAGVFRPADGPRGSHVLFVGTAHPRKNLEALGAACAASGRPLHAVLGPARDRPDAAELYAHAARPPLVVVDAPTDADLARELAAAAVFCLPSFSEGFGLPALEAMACGTPVVVGDGGALPEVVGDAGIVCAPEPAAIADGLARALADPSLGQRGRERALAFPWSRTAKGWLGSLRRAVESGP
jgi:glycosyltransferase involved in cell wall biosynthesis